MEPDFAMVGTLPLPKSLLKLIETGRWPRTHEEELRQNIRPLVSTERIKSFAPDQDRIYFVRPPFNTVAELIASHEGEFWSTFGALEQISPDLSVFIGDFGLGSDSPILLDYRNDRSAPSVIRLKLNPIHGETLKNGGKKVLGWANLWLRCADTFDAFTDILGLEQGVSS
jgi:hypothetical protein